MKILLLSIHDIPHIGGKSTHILNLSDALKTAGHQVEILSPADAPRLLRQLVVAIPSRFLRLARRDWATLYTYAVRRRILSWLLRKTSFNPDIINCQDPSSILAYEHSGRLEPTALTMHSYIGIEFLLDRTGIKPESKLYRAIVDGELHALRLARQVIAVDSRIAKHLENASPGLAHKTSVVKNFLDPENFVPASASVKDKMREGFGIKTNQQVILCPRRLVEKNGVRYAIESLMHLRDLDVRLVLAGGGDQRRALEQLVESLQLTDRVVFLGDVPNERMSHVYAMADVIVIPSVTANGLQEATSLSALEAMSSSKPVIASAIGGLAELITSGKTGILVEERNAEAIAAAVRQVLASPSQSLAFGNAARLHVITSHSLPAAAAEFLRIYQKANAEGRAL